MCENWVFSFSSRKNRKCDLIIPHNNLQSILIYLPFLMNKDLVVNKNSAYERRVGPETG